MRLCLLLCLPLLFLTEPRLAAAQSLQRTDPSHLPALGRDQGAPPDRRLERPVPPRDFIIYRLPWTRADLQKRGVRIDKALSELCRRGRFRQISDGQIRAALPDGWLGLGFADGRNLNDDTRAAKNNTAYIFELQDSSACVVRTIAANRIEPFLIQPPPGPDTPPARLAPARSAPQAPPPAR